MAIQIKDVCFSGNVPQNFVELARKVYPNATPIVTKLTESTKNTKIHYNPNGTFVLTGELTETAQRTIRDWGLSNNFIERATVYCVDDTAEGTETSKLFRTEQEALQYAKGKDVYTKQSLTTTPAYEGIIGIKEPLFDFMAELSIQLHYSLNVSNTDGVLISNINQSFGVIFNAKKSVWQALPNLAAYLLIEMQKNEKSVAVETNKYAQRNEKLKKLNSKARKGNSNYFVENVRDTVCLVAGNCQIGVCYNGGFYTCVYPNVSFAEMLKIAKKFKATEIVKVIEAQKLR